MQVSSNSKLKLSLSFPKETYKLGEPISPLFELKNGSNKPVIVLDKFGVETGFLKVFATKNNTDFIGFGNSRWGVLDSASKTYILPNESKRTTAGILWYVDSQGLPAFRLKEPGTYYFKSRYSVLFEGEKLRIDLESEPVQITIEEPIGEDLQVWNKIKDNGNFAYFIQEGDLQIPDYKPEERTKFLQQVEQILTDHPNSFYAESLRQSLTKFRASETKRQESLQKIQDQKEKPQ